MPSSPIVFSLALLSLLAPLASAYTNSLSPLSCTDLTAVSCSAKGLSQCCIAGGDCCPDGSCCNINQQCLPSGTSYVCCTNNFDCPSATTSSSSPGGSPFHAQIPCSPVDGDSWYCNFGQSCGYSSGSCIGVAVGGGGGSSSQADSSSTAFDSLETPAASSSDGAAATFVTTTTSTPGATATRSGNSGAGARDSGVLDGMIGAELLVMLAVYFAQH